MTAMPQVVAEHEAGAELAGGEGGGVGGAAGAAGVDGVVGDMYDMDDMPPPHAVKADIIKVHTAAESD